MYDMRQHHAVFGAMHGEGGWELLAVFTKAEDAADEKKRLETTGQFADVHVLQMTMRQVAEQVMADRYRWPMNVAAGARVPGDIVTLWANGMPVAAVKPIAP